MLVGADVSGAMVPALCLSECIWSKSPQVLASWPSLLELCSAVGDERWKISHDYGTNKRCALVRGCLEQCWLFCVLLTVFATWRLTFGPVDKRDSICCNMITTPPTTQTNPRQESKERISLRICGLWVSVWWVAASHWQKSQLPVRKVSSKPQFEQCLISFVSSSCSSQSCIGMCETVLVGRLWLWGLCVGYCMWKRGQIMPLKLISVHLVLDKLVHRYFSYIILIYVHALKISTRFDSVFSSCVTLHWLKVTQILASRLLYSCGTAGSLDSNHTI